MRVEGGAVDFDFDFDTETDTETETETKTKTDCRGGWLEIRCRGGYCRDTVRATEISP
jgi:hypothetical protein